YKLNYDKLGYEKEPTVPSPYTKNNLPLIIDESGEVFIDYRVDIQQEIDEHEVNYEEGEDIHSLFTDHYPFVPAYSKPYTIQEGEITIIEKEQSKGCFKTRRLQNIIFLRLVYQSQVTF